MPITYQEICEHIEREDYRLNGYKKETGGSDSTYVTLAPENYGDLHILIERRANNQVKLSFEVVNATAKDIEDVQRYCSANGWTCQKKREKIYRYIKEYNRNGGPTFFFNDIQNFENVIAAAQEFIEYDINEIKKIVNNAPPQQEEEEGGKRVKLLQNANPARSSILVRRGQERVIS